MQIYFKSKNCLSADSMRKIYSLRTRSLPLKCKAPSKYTDRLCLATGCLREDQEEHVYECAYLSEEEQVVQQLDIKYEDLFSSDVHKQETIKNIFFGNYLKRAKYLPSQRKWGPEAPQGGQPFGSRETIKNITRAQTKQAKL